MSRSYRLISKPHGAARLAIGFLIGAFKATEDAIAHALPEHAVVVTADGSPSWGPADLEQASKLAGLPTSAPLFLFGWSAGCQPIRQALLSRSIDAQLEGLACFDGTHGGFPEPLSAHVEAWRRVVERAKAGDIQAIFTCTSMGYTERLKPPDGPYMSTRHMLEHVLGETLEIGKPIDVASLYVERFESGDIDGPAHIRQVREVMPELLAKRVAPPASEGWWASRVVDFVLHGAGALARLGEGVSGGEACVAWCERELAAGVKEEPPGSNDSPRIREYFTVPDYRRAGQPLHVSKVAWCAAAQSMAHHECGLDLPAYVSGIEFETWAKATGRALGAGETPKKGDLAIFHRQGDGWERHVTRVRADAQAGEEYETIAGNEAGDRWAISKHGPAPKDPAFSMFVRI
jgi:hypothetical protein